MAQQDDHPKGFDKLGQDARLEARMLRDDQPVTQEQIDAILDAANDYFEQRKYRGNGYSYADFSVECGIGRNVLGRILKKTYDASYEPHARKLDAFLADQEKREGRFEFPAFVRTGVAEKVFAVITTAKRLNTLGVVIMEPGCGKSAIARAYAAENSTAVLVRIVERGGDSFGVVEALYRELDLGKDKVFRDRLAAIRQHLFRRRSIVILIDEAQKLQPSGLEVIRDLHDSSDPAAQFCVPFCLFGDRDFYRLIVKAQNGQPSPIKPQMTSRMAPIFDAEKDAKRHNDGKRYTIDDLRKLLRSNRVKLVTERGVRLMLGVANEPGWGALRLVKQMMGIAKDLTDEGRQIDEAKLYEAMEMVLSPDMIARFDRPPTMPQAKKAIA